MSATIEALMKKCQENNSICFIDTFLLGKREKIHVFRDILRPLAEEYYESLSQAYQKEIDGEVLTSKKRRRTEKYKKKE